MTIPVTTESVLFSIAVLSAAFAIYRSYTQPNEAQNTAIALLQQGQATLAGKVEKMITNDLPHIDAKVDAIRDDLNRGMGSTSDKLTKLSTIIEERIPKAIV